MRICTLLILVHFLVVCSGCREHPVPDKTLSATPTATAENVTMAPRHPNMEVFVNMRTSPDVAFDNKDGCTSCYSPQIKEGGTRISYGLECGYPGAVSELTWNYTRSNDNGDHYHFVRLFPHGEPDQKSSKLEVVFAGDEIVLFEDDWQRIVLRAKPLGH